MSTFKATIVDIQSEGMLHIVSFETKTTILKMMSLALDIEIQVGSDVLLSVKATAVALAKDIQGTLSYSNQISCTILTIERGKLLTSLQLQEGAFTLESIITTDSCERMQLLEGQDVTALIKSSDLSICEIL